LRRQLQFWLVLILVVSISIIAALLYTNKEAAEKAVPIQEKVVNNGDVAEAEAPESIIAVHNFEEGEVLGWVPRGGVVITLTDEAAKTGTHSLKVSNRTEGWHGPSLNVAPILVKRAKYEVIAYIRLVEAPESPSTVKLTMERKPIGGEVGWDTIAQADVSHSEWVELKGTYTFENEVETMSLYAESSNASDAFYLDDVTIKMVDGPGEVEAQGQAHDKGIQIDIPSLHEQFTDAFEIGAAINPYQTEGKYGALIKKHYNAVVAENVMKPGPIQPTEGKFNWDGVDQIVKFAQDNGQTIRFHTLVWHSQAAEWMFLDIDGNPMAPTEANKKLLLNRMETHIRTVVDRYKGDIRDWDVVNEVIDPGQSDGMRRSKWFEITGTEYIARAFEVTREVAGVGAQLYINDYNTHEPKKRDFMYKLITDMLDRGVPIDGVGHQTHINITNPSVDLMRESIEKFASIGLDNQITELDISIYSNDTDKYDEVPEEILIQQAHRYREVFDMFLELKDYISSVVLWGTDDGKTWLSTFPITRINLPLLFDKDLQAKPSYWALVDYAKVPAPPGGEVIGKQTTQAYKGKPKIDGEMDASWSRTAEIATNISVSGNEEAKAKVRTMWENGYLYVYAHVTDAKLSKTSDNVWEHDSLEIFVDQNNAQTEFYESDDGQFRVNYANEHSYNGMASPENFITATKLLEDGYIVEAAIKLNPELIKSGAKIGYDIQVNNDQDGDGTRDSVTIWSDPTGFSYQNTKNFGTIELIE